ncbi:hypothetical protein I7093_004470 [Vibrio parahaemolyticus]|nr:hypothetical protein [Vibrio parahaemolyticus]
MLSIWAIGVLFTMGYVLDSKSTSVWQQLKIAVLNLVLWPVVLGHAMSKNHKSKSYGEVAP